MPSIIKTFAYSSSECVSYSLMHQLFFRFTNLLLSLYPVLFIKTRSTTVVDPRHRNSRISQRVRYQSNHKLLHHYQHSKNWLHPFLTMFNQKHFWSAFNVWWSCINMQKICLYIPFVHSSDTLNFRVPSKNQLVSSVRSWDTVNFRVQRPEWPHSFLTTPHQKRFNQLLILGNS